MKNKKVEISRINIKIGDKEINLSLEEAQELREILDETFDKEVRYISPSPVVIERPCIRPYPYPYWSVTYDGTGTIGNSATFTLNSGGAISAINTGDFDALPIT